ncbi:hypothetical protein [Streptomyces sp. NPDC054961]
MSLHTMLTEIDELLEVKAISLPPDPFIDMTPKVLSGGRRPQWSLRAA